MANENISQASSSSDEDVKERTLDVKRMVTIQRGQIYACSLDEPTTESRKNNSQFEFSKTGLIGKKRPCLIISNDNINKNGSLYRIVPIKTNHTDLSPLEYAAKSSDILIPIEMAEDTKFLVINQTRPINISSVGSYVATITNTKLLDKVDKAIMEMDTGFDTKYLSSAEALVTAASKYFDTLDDVVKFFNDPQAANILRAWKSGDGEPDAL